jgi:hypothetical protein
MDILEQALRGGLKPNMTNNKGDSLVSLGACDRTFFNAGWVGISAACEEWHLLQGWLQEMPKRY